MCPMVVGFPQNESLRMLFLYFYINLYTLAGVSACDRERYTCSNGGIHHLAKQRRGGDLEPSVYLSYQPGSDSSNQDGNFQE